MSSPPLSWATSWALSSNKDPRIPEYERVHLAHLKKQQPPPPSPAILDWRKIVYNVKRQEALGSPELLKVREELGLRRTKGEEINSEGVDSPSLATEPPPHPFPHSLERDQGIQSTSSAPAATISPAAKEDRDFFTFANKISQQTTAATTPNTRAIAPSYSSSSSSRFIRHPLATASPHLPYSVDETDGGNSVVSAITIRSISPSHGKKKKLSLSQSVNLRKISEKLNALKPLKPKAPEKSETQDTESPYMFCPFSGQESSPILNGTHLSSDFKQETVGDVLERFRAQTLIDGEMGKEGGNREGLKSSYDDRSIGGGIFHDADSIIKRIESKLVGQNISSDEVIRVLRSTLSDIGLKGGGETVGSSSSSSSSSTTTIATTNRHESESGIRTGPHKRGSLVDFSQSTISLSNDPTSGSGGGTDIAMTMLLDQDGIHSRIPFSSSPVVHANIYIHDHDIESSGQDVTATLTSAPSSSIASTSLSSLPTTRVHVAGIGSLHDDIGFFRPAAMSPSENDDLLPPPPVAVSLPANNPKHRSRKRGSLHDISSGIPQCNDSLSPVGTVPAANLPSPSPTQVHIDRELEPPSQSSVPLMQVGIESDSVKEEAKSDNASESEREYTHTGVSLVFPSIHETDKTEDQWEDNESDCSVLCEEEVQIDKDLEDTQDQFDNEQLLGTWAKDDAGLQFEHVVDSNVVKDLSYPERTVESDREEASSSSPVTIPVPVASLSDSTSVDEPSQPSEYITSQQQEDKVLESFADATDATSLQISFAKSDDNVPVPTSLSSNMQTSSTERYYEVDLSSIPLLPEDSGGNSGGAMRQSVEMSPSRPLHSSCSIGLRSPHVHTGIL